MIDIVVIAYNSIGNIEACLDSIFQHTPFPKRVVVVDNGSTDQTCGYVSARQDVELLANSTNEGYAKAVNRGIRSGSHEYIVILNDDTRVTEGWLEPILDCFGRDAKVGIVAPKLINYNGRLVGVGTDWNWKMPHFMQPDAPGILAEERDCLAINGACFVIKRSLLPKLGLLDENYPFYFEETDYCFNANYLGYRVVFCGNSKVYHDFTMSDTRKSAVSTYWSDSSKYFNQKWSYDPDTRKIKKSG